ncbi:MAG: ABC transporter permease [Gemmatimonadota bacterium]|nr:MAG: ABC transporter permease [Gemmatimonadota bacterium]
MTTVWVRIYRALLRLYPRGMRVRDGHEMLGLFVDLLEEERRERGSMAAAKRAIGVYLEVPRSAWAAHVAVRRTRQLGRLRRGHFVGDVGTDLRRAAVSLRRSPGFVAVALLTLALGMGATTAMFTLIHATLLRPLPFPEPDNLYMVYLTTRTPGRETRPTRWSYGEFQVLRDRDLGFQGLAAFARAEFNLTGEGVPYHVRGEVVSSGYFAVLGVPTALGRTFLAGEDGASGRTAVAVVSDELWRSALGGRGGLRGEQIKVNGVAMEVIGVMPPGFKGLTGRADVWVTHAMAPEVYYPSHFTSHQHFLNVAGRLRDGQTVESVASALNSLEPTLAEQFGAQHEGEGQWGATLRSLGSERIDPAVRRASLVLFGAAFLVLMIASANLAALLLSRGLARQREMAIRRALGSSRARLVREALIESGLLGLSGGALGLLLTLWLTQWGASFLSARLATRQLSQFATVSVDGSVLLFTAIVSLGTGLVFGLGPALRASRADVDMTLRGGARAGPAMLGGRRPGPFAVLVVSEFTLALILLVGASLMLETLDNLRARAPGFDPEGVVTFRIQPPLAEYSSEQGPALLERVLDAVSGIQGVTSASVGPCAPLMTTCAWREVRLPLEVDPGGAVRATFRRHYVGPDFLRTLGIPLLRGRWITRGDRQGSPNVTVVNRRAAETLWPGEDPIGKRVVLGSGEFMNPDSTAIVVGMVADVRYGTAEEPIGLDIYTSYRQFSRSFTYVMVKSDLPLSTLVPELRSAIRGVDPDLPIYDVATMGSRGSSALARPRFTGFLLASFAALALVLAALGIYGVMSELVSRRRRELGVRMAIGADRRILIRYIVGRGATLALAGVSLGVVGALILARVLESQLWGVSSTDGLVLAGAATFLLAVGLVAVLVPAIRAARVDPVVVLRSE